MNLDKGKPITRKIVFLGKPFSVTKIPVGIAAPIAVELNKIRKLSLKAAEALANESDTLEHMETRVAQYFMEHGEEAHEFNVLSVKIVSIYTEFFTDGQMDEEYIFRNADPDEVNDFMALIQEAVNAPLKKRLEKLEKEAANQNPQT